MRPNPRSRKPALSAAEGDPCNDERCCAAEGNSLVGQYSAGAPTHQPRRASPERSRRVPHITFHLVILSEAGSVACDRTCASRRTPERRMPPAAEGSSLIGPCGLELRVLRTRGTPPAAPAPEGRRQNSPALQQLGTSGSMTPRPKGATTKPRTYSPPTRILFRPMTKRGILKAIAIILAALPLIFNYCWCFRRRRRASSQPAVFDHI